MIVRNSSNAFISVRPGRSSGGGAVGIAALKVPSTGIVDFVGVTEAFARIVAKEGGELRTGADGVQPDEIDAARAKLSRDQLEKQINAWSGSEDDLAIAKTEFERSVVRMQLASRG